MENPFRKLYGKFNHSVDSVADKLEYKSERSKTTRKLGGWIGLGGVALIVFGTYTSSFVVEDACETRLHNNPNASCTHSDEYNEQVSEVGKMMTAGIITLGLAATVLISAHKRDERYAAEEISELAQAQADAKRAELQADMTLMEESGMDFENEVEKVRVHDSRFGKSLVYTDGPIPRLPPDPTRPQ